MYMELKVQYVHVCIIQTNDDLQFRSHLLCKVSIVKAIKYQNKDA